MHCSVDALSIGFECFSFIFDRTCERKSKSNEQSTGVHQNAASLAAGKSICSITKAISMQIHCIVKRFTGVEVAENNFKTDAFLL